MTLLMIQHKTHLLDFLFFLIIISLNRYFHLSSDRKYLLLARVYLVITSTVQVGKLTVWAPTCNGHVVHRLFCVFHLLTSHSRMVCPDFGN